MPLYNVAWYDQHPPLHPCITNTAYHKRITWSYETLGEENFILLIVVVVKCTMGASIYSSGNGMLWKRNSSYILYYGNEISNVYILTMERKKWKITDIYDDKQLYYEAAENVTYQRLFSRMWLMNSTYLACMYDGPFSEFWIFPYSPSSWMGINYGD